VREEVDLDQHRDIHKVAEVSHHQKLFGGLILNKSVGNKKTKEEQIEVGDESWLLQDQELSKTDATKTEHKDNLVSHLLVHDHLPMSSSCFSQFQYLLVFFVHFLTFHHTF